MLFMENSYFDSVFSHYKECWKKEPNIYLWDKGPMEKMPHDFRILEFAPNKERNIWTYATCGMSKINFNPSIELHIFSSNKDEGIIELLTTVAFYHRTVKKLDVNHTVNFGQPWQKKSVCEFGLISLPYLDGPSLENLELGGHLIKFYWLIPITKNEVEYKKKYGLEALETKFEQQSFNYINTERKSVV
jgi:Suppressor of fused protein (SUFU)